MCYIKYLFIGLCSCFIWMFAEAKKNKVSKEYLNVQNLPESFAGRSIFFISDIHVRTISKKIIQNAEQAELVIIGGDLTEKGVPYSRVRQNIRQLRQIGRVIFVWGNNDVEENPGILYHLLLEEGVIILENSIYSWTSGEDTIYIAGAGNSTLSLDPAFLHALQQEMVTLVVAHDPDLLEKLDHLEKVNAAFSGHTHGGQIRIGRLSPGESGGWKFRFGFPLLISNGYGTTMLPLRLNAPAQTHLITLKQGKP